MGTSVTLKDLTKDRLELFRHPDHDRWDDTLNGLMDIVPSIEEVQEEGCAKCGETAFTNAPIEEVGGFIHYFNDKVYGPEGGEHDVQLAKWFCSQECAREAIEEQEKYAARDPDKVVIGGKDEFRCEVTDATFHMDGEHMEVGLGIAGAFDGTSSHGAEYDYAGEPVYVKNKGEWVHSGPIEDIIHEEGHTGIVIGWGAGAGLGAYHPDDEMREDARERWADWRDAICPECGYTFEWCAKQDYEPEDNDAPEECPECEAEISPEEYDADDGTPGIPPWEGDE